MLKFIFGTINAILVSIQAILWLRVLFVFINVNQSSWFVAKVFQYSDAILQPFGDLINVQIQILGHTLDLLSLVVIFILSIISYAIIQISKGYE